MRFIKSEKNCENLALKLQSRFLDPFCSDPSVGPRIGGELYESVGVEVLILLSCTHTSY